MPDLILGGKAKQPKSSMIAQNKREAVNFGLQFYQTSWDWRAQAYHQRWDRWERNFHNIYDPNIVAKKEPWQTMMFDPQTVNVVEVICSALMRILLGTKTPIHLEPREGGDLLQAELQTALLDYQLDRSEFSIAVYDALKESLIYGSGFVKIYWKRIEEMRRLMEPVRESYLEAFTNFRKPRVTGMKETIKKVLAFDGIAIEKVHVRDIFLEPNSTTMERVLHRDRMPYFEIMKFADEGVFDKESAQALKNRGEADRHEEEKASVLNELGLTDPVLARPGYSKLHTIFELYAPMPRRFIELDIAPESDKGEEIVPGKLMMTKSGYFLASEENPFQSMKPPFGKVDYIRSGKTYGIGAAELIEGLQEEINEIRNLRVDNLNLAMNKVVAVIEKYLVDPKDLVSKPGGVWRFKGHEEIDLSKILRTIEFADVSNSTYREPLEIERKIQEVSGANRVTTGSAGLVDDQNKTLGGMRMLQQAAVDRFTSYAFIIGRAFMMQLAKKYNELIYQNMKDEDIARVLGMQPLEILPGEIIPKYQAYIRKDPLEVERDYDFKPVDIFNLDNKTALASQIMAYEQMVAQLLPNHNPRPALEEAGKHMGFDSDLLYRILGPDTGPGPNMLAETGKGMPSPPKAVMEKDGMPSAMMPQTGGIANPGMKIG